MGISLCDHILLILSNKYIIILKTNNPPHLDISSNGIVVLFLMFDCWEVSKWPEIIIMPEMYLSEFLFSCANIYVHLKYSDRQKEETQNPFQLQGKLAGHTWSPALKLGTTQSGQPPHEGCWEKSMTRQFLNFLGSSVPVLASTVLDDGVSWVHQHIDLKVV